MRGGYRRHGGTFVGNGTLTMCVVSIYCGGVHQQSYRFQTLVVWKSAAHYMQMGYNCFD